MSTESPDLPERICLLCGTISLHTVCVECDPQSVYDLPTGNHTWWDHPDVDLIGDMRCAVQRERERHQ